MIHPLLLVVFIAAMPIWGVWALRKSMKKGAITYEGRILHRQEQPAAFWVTMLLISFFGFVAPVVLAIGEYDRLAAFLGAK
ncbi:hypothetical protein [Erythrobacter tepidarius]|uniref:hypothetical protein n=1 Tax=Erythrobacter tepidarius TaxID=60454 RepID=UPI00117C5F7D|nr:hypothetical protein [Erythrobacter tepidarius]